MNLNLHYTFFQLFMVWGSPCQWLFPATHPNHQEEAEGKVTQHFLLGLMLITVLTECSLALRALASSYYSLPEGFQIFLKIWGSRPSLYEAVGDRLWCVRPHQVPPCSTLLKSLYRSRFFFFFFSKKVLVTEWLIWGLGHDPLKVTVSVYFCDQLAIGHLP
jgi:hypothetical protein